MTKLFPLILLILVSGCKKEKINVSSIYMTDQVGNPMGSFPNDNQWKQQTLSASELALFKDLDTADLSGTSMPTINNHFYASPNPFDDYFSVSASVVQPFSGIIVVKYVIVNSEMKIKKSGTFRMQPGNAFIYIIRPDLNPGKYRFYFSYDAEGHEHFYTGYGNIQKLP